MDDLKYKAFIQESPALSTGFRSGIRVLCTSFFGKFLLTENIHHMSSDKTVSDETLVQEVLKALQDRVKLNSSAFDDILSVLHSTIGMGFLAKRLENALQQIKEDLHTSKQEMIVVSGECLAKLDVVAPCRKLALSNAEPVVTDRQAKWSPQPHFSHMGLEERSSVESDMQMQPTEGWSQQSFTPDSTLNHTPNPAHGPTSSSSAMIHHSRGKPEVNVMSPLQSQGLPQAQTQAETRLHESRDATPSTKEPESSEDKTTEHQAMPETGPHGLTRSNSIYSYLESRRLQSYCSYESDCFGTPPTSPRPGTPDRTTTGANASRKVLECRHKIKLKEREREVSSMRAQMENLRLELSDERWKKQELEQALEKERSHRKKEMENVRKKENIQRERESFERKYLQMKNKSLEESNRELYENSLRLYAEAELECENWEEQPYPLDSTTVTARQEEPGYHTHRQEEEERRPVTGHAPPCPTHRSDRRHVHISSPVTSHVQSFQESRH